MSARRRSAALALALVATAAAGWRVGLPWARDYARRGVRVSIQEVLVRDGAATPGSGLGRLASRLRSAVGAVFADELSVRLRIHNATLLPARVSAARYQVRIGSHPIGSGVWNAPGGAHWFLPGRDVELVAALDPNWGSLTGAGIDKLARKRLPITAAGGLSVALVGVTVEVPFEVSRVDWAR